MSVDATRWAWMQKSLRPAQKLILLSLADRANEEHVCWPSLERLRTDTGLDIRTIRASLKDLCEGGLMVKKYIEGRGYIYRLVGVGSREMSDNQYYSTLEKSDIPSTAFDTPLKNAGCKNVPSQKCPLSKMSDTPLKNVSNPPSKMYPESKRESNKNLKEKKRARAPQSPKLPFGKFGNVKLTEEEHSKLIAEQPDLAQEAIDKLDAYIGSKGDKYKSHYMAMHSWVFKAVLEDRQKGVIPQGAPQSLEEMFRQRGVTQ